MDSEHVKAYYRRPEVLDHYVRAASAVGLWQSEEKIIRRLFQPGDRILELGTGAGRIAFGMEEIGYQHIMAVDLSKEMVAEARRLAGALESRVVFQVADARKLSFPDASFDGAIFGFNGLMQIPGRRNRVAALKEIRRVLRPGAWFVFTTHDRNNPRHEEYWRQQREIWDAGGQDPLREDFGDRYEDTPLGRLFIHVPVPEETRADLAESGWRVEVDIMRSQLANENPATREFSDDCRFWIVQKAVPGS